MHAISFIQDLAVIMLVAGVVTILFHRFKQPVVLGYYLSGEDRDGITKGMLPDSALPLERLRGLPLGATTWRGYSSNIEALTRAAPAAGFFNSITDEDGVVRSLPLLAEYQGQYYESLALAMFRRHLA